MTTTMARRCGLGFATLVAAADPISPAALAHDVTRERAKADGLIANQLEAWNRGDLPEALATYCPSADITWVSNAGISHGYEQFARGMREQFGGGPARMGKLDIKIVDVRQFGDGSNLIVVRWSITRGGSRLMGGLSSQLWADCDGRMRVVFEHAS